MGEEQKQGTIYITYKDGNGVEHTEELFGVKELEFEPKNEIGYKGANVLSGADIEFHTLNMRLKKPTVRKMKKFFHKQRKLIQRLKIAQRKYERANGVKINIVR